MMKTVTVVLGTRPEVIKLAPVIRELRRSGCASVRVVTTGQHDAVLRPLLEHFAIDSVISLPITRKSGTLAELVGLVAGELDRLLRHEHNDGIIVQGDTTSAMVAAICGFGAGIPVFHIEAGLRTGNLEQPFPEEFNRRVITLAATQHFAPTERSKANLVSEGVDPSRCHVVGNTCIDALLWTLERARGATTTKFRSNSFGILATCHRRENWDGGLDAVCSALRDISARIPSSHILFPVHPNPSVRCVVERELGNVANVCLTEPLDYAEFCTAMRDAAVIISDSGGVQEEALALGKPTLVTRWTTERPEVLDGHTVKLVGPDRRRIVAEASTLYEDIEAYRAANVASFPFGRGDSAQHIVRKLQGFLNS